MTALLAAIAGAQLVLVACGLPGWPCPLLHGAGIPCPGCGLSRAVLELLRGEWGTAISRHAFSPLLLLAIALVGLGSLLPERARLALAGRVEQVERSTGVSALLGVGLLAYWIIRWASAPEAFLALVGGGA